MLTTTSETSSSTQNTKKNNAVSHCQWGRADEIALFKAFLHNCGHAGISSKQFKIIKQNKRMYATFSESQKTKYNSNIFSSSNSV